MKKNKFIFVIFLFLCNCGTDTGNPTFTNNGPPLGSISASTTSQLTNVMCNKIRECFDPALSGCEVKMLTAVNLPTELGLNETTYPDLYAIQTAIDATTLHVDEAKKTTCLISVSNSNCASTQVQQSYSSSSLEDLTQAWKMISSDPNCSQFIY